jgi:hypothetical protein
MSLSRHLAIYLLFTPRLAREHPEEENLIDTDTGRVFGNLMPTRAFGKLQCRLLFAAQLIGNLKLRRFSRRTEMV